MLIYICEESESDTLALKRHLDSYSKTRHIDLEAVSFCSGRELLTSYLNTPDEPEILFLSSSPDGENGMETLRQMQAAGYFGCVIFTSPPIEGKLESYHDIPLYYLEKPYEDKEIAAAMEHFPATLWDAPQNFLLIQKKHKYSIPYTDILFFETGQQHTVILHTCSDSYTFRGTLSQIAEIFRHRDNFLCVGRSFLINLNHVKGRLQDDLIMSDDSIVQVPLRKQEMVFSKIKCWQTPLTSQTD